MKVIKYTSPEPSSIFFFFLRQKASNRTASDVWQGTIALFAIGADAFVPVHSPASKTSTSSSLCAENKLTLIDDPDVVAKPVAFRLADSEKKTAGEESVIECYVDAIAKINDVDYSVGFPVDHAVDIAVIEEDEDGEEGLTLLETDDPIMDKLSFCDRQADD